MVPLAELSPRYPPHRLLIEFVALRLLHPGYPPHRRLLINSRFQRFIHSSLPATQAASNMPAVSNG